MKRLSEKYYTIAYKTQENRGRWRTLAITGKRWYADPILFEYNGVNYVFLEIFEKKYNRGCIGVSLIKNGIMTEPEVIIREKYHMSFPYIFRHKENIYMIPETCESGSLCLYKCEEFPMVWKKTDFIVGEEYKRRVDSVILEWNQELFLIGSDINPYNPNQSKLAISRISINSDKLKLKSWEGFIDRENINYTYDGRNAGPIIYYRGQIYRVCQVSDKREYGKKVIIKRVEFDNHYYREKKCKDLMTVKGKEWQAQNVKEFIGFHTYGKNKSCEVIDIRFWHCSFVQVFYRCIHACKRIVMSKVGKALKLEKIRYCEM